MQKVLCPYLAAVEQGLAWAMCSLTFLRSYCSLALKVTTVSPRTPSARQVVPSDFNLTLQAYHNVVITPGIVIYVFKILLFYNRNGLWIL